MTDTAKKIMDLFRSHDKVKTGMVLPAFEISFDRYGLGPSDIARLDEAIEELKSEGFILVTPQKGLELTEGGFNYLFGDA